MHSSRKAFWRVLSFALALCMLVGLIPVQVLATESESNDNQNNVTVPVEDWTYTPGQVTAHGSATVMAGESSSDILKVYVTATERSSGSDVTVPGATVNLYIGSSLHSSHKDEDGDGMVEISLAGISYEDRLKATVSASKVVSRGKAIDGDDRDDLFEYFPKDEDGEYYRYTMELHSESIDRHGNWLGTEIPVSKESNKVDIVFIIDATGSMSDEINNVRDNIASFSENLIESGLDNRFCIIDYRDITCGEDTYVHINSGTHWLKDIGSVVNALDSIVATGGGDGPESVLDPLGYVADNRQMQWRSDAYRFAFVLTDANYKVANNYGYDSMDEVVEQLKRMEVVTSVITSSSHSGDYYDLYHETGGIYANIYSGDFDQEMLELSDSIVESVTKEMTLHLHEPRMLVNMSVCYFADDATSMSTTYRDSVKNVMNEFAHRLAETTDGHVLLDKVILFSTANRTNFYNTRTLASMADIRIETKVEDVGLGGANVTIGSNAYVAGFFSDNKYTGSSSDFKNLADGTDIDGKKSFYRIQLSGTTYSWDATFTDSSKVYEYSTTIMHEAGHYLLGFYDEYLDANGKNWNNGDGVLGSNESQWTQPYFGASGDRIFGGYGLMDNHHYGDIEISNTNIDYAYMTAGFAGSPVSLHTRQSYRNNGSCEDSLATLLTDESFATYYSVPKDNISSSDFDLGEYESSYSKVRMSNDRTALYSYAGLNADDFISIRTSGGYGGGGAGGGGGGGGHRGHAATVNTDGSTFTTDAVAEVTFTPNEDTVTMEVAEDTDCTVGIQKAGDEEFAAVELTDGSAELEIAKGELAEVRIIVDGEYNVYFIDRSEDTEIGCLYTSADNAVMAYVNAVDTNAYTFIANNLRCTNGDYRSVNQATRIIGDFDGGEIYSVADFMDEIDYTTLQWFKYADGTWTALETDISEEENMNLGGRADLDGEGLYVLMAQAASVGEAGAAQNLAYTQSEDKDAVVFLSFDDPNETSKYYNVYYSDDEFVDTDAEGVVVRSYPADYQTLSLNLLERGREVYAAVEIVLEDGSRSALSEIILIGGEADSDGDGIPDWYCDLYHLWGEDGEDKDIANSDDDGDGRTNLEEYLGGSDPTNPNDPVHTTNIPVTSITVSDTDVNIFVGQVARLTATVMPENATDKNVNWTSADPEIASVEVSDGVCLVSGNQIGETLIYAVTSDGGYSVEIQVTVTEGGGVDRLAGSDRYYTCISVANQLKENLGVEKFESVVIAYGQNFPDALTGSYLAAVKNAPILLWESAVDARMMIYIAENLIPGGTIYILGGDSVVSPVVEAAARYLGYNPIRLKGANRYETNLAILNEAGVNTEDEVLIATGKNYADSLSASATGLPMLLVGDELTVAQRNFLLTTSRRFVIIGGTGAVSESVEEELSMLGSVVRIKGSSRYETSVEIARRYFDNPRSVVLAYSHGFPDGLCGGPLAVSMGAPLILTSNDGYTVADEYVEGIRTGAVTGGTGRISDETVRDVFELDDGVEIPKK